MEIMICKHWDLGIWIWYLELEVEIEKWEFLFEFQDVKNYTSSKKGITINDIKKLAVIMYHTTDSLKLS